MSFSEIAFKMSETDQSNLLLFFRSIMQKSNVQK
jgi:hypothetical protein